MPEHKTIYQQELWKFFERQAEHELVTAVKTVCEHGLDLSKDIIRFFPTFTLHDETHSANVCRWMWILLGDYGRENLTAQEAALLLMAACCHDIGMAVSKEQEARMCQRTYPGWDDYFQRNLRDDEEYERTKVISRQMLRNFVRMHHHERIGKNLRKSDWPGALNRKGITWETLLKLCRSHGTELSQAELRAESKFDLLLCAVLLRLADLLDYDNSRAPAVLFRHMGLDKPANAAEARSAVEYGNNQAGTFDETITNGVISYYAEYNAPQQEQNVQGYLDWVCREMKHCAEELARTGSHWRGLSLPYRINTDGVVRNGYAARKFSMTMDQDRIMEMLTGEKLYADAGVFVRELLQNSIDAVLLRAKQDPGFSLEDGLIQIDSWMDEKTGDTWFRIRDNGTGMNEHIIANHFLKVGNSYYTSDEFRYANRHAAGEKYTAISRFGIGILSCFMGDKEHTQLKVSTKRFDEPGENGIRLDVTGIHGCYFLCNEKDHPEYEDWFPWMPSPDAENRGYRGEPGTTLCVNTNLIQLGELRSVREILDAYVHFPEVPVVYNGPQGRREYPTQQMLMEAVHGLNPDGVVKKHVYEFPDAWMAELREEFPRFDWVDRPRVELCYEPVDWLSDSADLTGVILSAAVRWPEIELVLQEKGGNRHLRLETDWRLSSEGRLIIECHLGRYRMVGKRDFDGEDDFGVGRTFTFLLVGPGSPLTEQEQAVVRMVGPLRTGQEAYAYYGILAGERKSRRWGIRNRESLAAGILFRGPFRPEVNLARSEIHLRDPEASACMAMANEKSVVGLGWMDLEDPRLQLYTERELREVLKRHPEWHHALRSDGSIFYSNRTLVQGLRITAMKETGALYADFRRGDRFGQLIRFSGEAPDRETEMFPATMFFRPEAEGSPLCGAGMIYNREHPFSRWLIRNRAALEEQVPVLYRTMIETMMLKNDPREIRDTLNSTLRVLKARPGNPFGVPAELVLTEEDFSNAQGRFY